MLLHHSGQLPEQVLEGHHEVDLLARVKQLRHLTVVLPGTPSNHQLQSTAAAGLSTRARAC